MAEKAHNQTLSSHSSARVLVTGVTGFVGCQLLPHLLKEGFSVKGAYHPESTTPLPDNIDTAPVDIGSDVDWRSHLEGVETIVHLAAKVHQMKESGLQSLAAYREVNVAGTVNLARQAADCGVRRFIFISSVKVNGEENSAPYSEEQAVHPQDPYGISKMEAELELRKIEEEAGLEVIILRPPLIYGPGVKANFLKLIQLVDRGIPLPFLTGKNKRSFLYVGNLVDCILHCMKSPGAAGETFFVSDDRDLSTSELVRLLAGALGRSPRLFFFPRICLQLLCRVLRKEGAFQRVAGSLTVNSRKVQQVLRWSPPYSVEEGISSTVSWYRSSKT